jgi:4-hydroxy-tetrahydrodipicolinate synthase
VSSGVFARLGVGAELLVTMASAAGGDVSSGPQGVFLPLVTPFHNGKVDHEAFRRLVERYVGKKLSGIIPLGTTGEVPTVEDDEYLRILEDTIEVVAGRTSIYTGVSSNNTSKCLHLIKKLDRYSIDGYLVTAPYYNLPSQEGIYNHFRLISESTERSILMYNIPYRTGRNMENETILRLSKLPNVVGIKDSCGNVSQTIELLRDGKNGFSVLTGEDILYYFNLVSGGSGGILASAHFKTEVFVEILRLVSGNDHKGALAKWEPLSKVIPLLFREPNPAPIKYVLAQKGLIRSDEVRPPLAGITASLKTLLDGLIEKDAI